jgi:hypothetical protein
MSEPSEKEAVLLPPPQAENNKTAIMQFMIKAIRFI